MIIHDYFLCFHRFRGVITPIVCCDPDGYQDKDLKSENIINSF
jgi:hypothetical protein